jgi:hypothetical protein
MKKSFISALILIGAHFGILHVLHAQTNVEWVSYKGNLPANVVYGGQENGQKLAVCRCNYNGALHAGKVVSGKCNIGWGGREIIASSFEILVKKMETDLNWVSISGGNMPTNAVISGVENGRQLYVGKANYANGVHPGKVFWNGSRFICNIGYGGKEYTLMEFKVLTTGQSETSNQQMPAQEAPAQPATAGCTLPSFHWNLNGSYVSLKEDGSMTVFKGQPIGSWQCVNRGTVKLNFSGGQSTTFVMNADGTMTTSDGAYGYIAKPMTKEEKDAMKTVMQVDDAMKKLFKKN